VTLAPLLPCDPDHLMDRALHVTEKPILCDPLHTRATKPRGATTRETAMRISERLGLEHWHDPEFQHFTVGANAGAGESGGASFCDRSGGVSILTES